MKRSDSSPPFVRAVVACVVLGVVMVSCGDDDDSASTAATTPATPLATAGTTSTETTAPAAESSATGSSTAPSGDVCADREALRTSVDALTNVDVVAEGTNGVTAAVSDVKEDLAALRSSAGDELQPQVQAVQDAVDEGGDGSRQPRLRWRRRCRHGGGRAGDVGADVARFVGGRPVWSVDHVDDVRRSGTVMSRRDGVVVAVRARTPVDDREERSIGDVPAALERLGDDPFDEHANPVHATASGLIVGRRGVVLHRHRLLGAWVAPGGHVDADEQPWEAAVREAREETGLRHLGLANGSSDLVHVDVHPGPRSHTHSIWATSSAATTPIRRRHWTRAKTSSGSPGPRRCDRGAIDDRDPHPPVEEAVNGTGGHEAGADHVNHVMTDRVGNVHARSMTMTTEAGRHPRRELIETEGM